MSCQIQKVEANVGYLDIEVAQGADTDINITYKLNGTVVNLTGFTAKLQVRRNYNTAVLLELNTVGSTITVGSASPNIVLKFGHVVTSAMSILDDMIYDLEVVSGGGFITKVVRGKFSILQEITL